MRIHQTMLSVVALAGGIVLAAGMAHTGVLLRPVTEAAELDRSAQNTQDVRMLVPGTPIERELAGGQVHTYQVALTAGQYLRVVVDQRGIDVVVILFGPDGQQIIEVDGPSRAQGPEPVSVIAEASGSYQMEVRPLKKEAVAGRYEIKIEELRPATAKDGHRIAAERAFAEGGRLRKQGTPESLRRAIEKYQAALPLWRAAGEGKEEAKTLNDICLVYDALGERQTAFDYCHQSLQLSRELGDRVGEAHRLNDLGMLYADTGDKLKAINLISQARQIFNAHGERRAEANTLNNLGGLYADLGELQESIDHLSQALPLFRATGDRRREAISLSNIGLTYLDLGEKQRALDYLSQALPLLRSEGDNRMEAALLNNIGRIYHDLGEKQKALDHLDQALRIWRSVGSRRGLAFALHNLGGVYYDLGDKRRALDYLSQALQLTRDDKDRYGEAQGLHAIAGIYAAFGEQQKALDHYHQALSLRRELEDRGGEAGTLSGIARVERDRGHLAEAQTNIEAALKIVESLRANFANPELRASHLASVHGRYKLYIDLLMQRHKQSPSEGYDAAALQASERARARTLLESLAEMRADIRQGVDPVLLERERSLQQQLNAKAERLTRLLSGKHTEEQAAAAKKEVEAITNEYQQVQTQIRQNSPRYAALTQPVPLSLQEIQQQVLDSDSLLLEYALGEERSHLWAVTPTSIAGYELPKRAEIETAAQRLYNLLMISHRRESKRATELAAAELSRMVLGPVARQLGNKRLLVVSDGALQYVPFAALPLPETERQRDRERERKRELLSVSPSPRLSVSPTPLIAEHEIVHLPSASALAVLRRELAGRQAASRAVAALADPVLQSDDARVKEAMAKARKETDSPEPAPDNTRRTSESLVRSAREAGVVSLERLQFTREEAEAIVSQTREEKSLKALDFVASRATATNPELSQYRVVHFATHGLLNSQHPELSGIVLSLVDERGQPQDGFLRLHDIYNLKLGAELVVLSACQTALGKDVKGEGLVGLTRGFMYAGAARVVASLWNVRDRATAELMNRFYRGMLKEGLRPTAALRAAQVSMWREKRWEAPYYWAGFVLQGEWR
jgi:CHAT domain-containing protein/Tfp pilus assembly protein PilF